MNKLFTNQQTNCLSVGSYRKFDSEAVELVTSRSVDLVRPYGKLLSPTRPNPNRYTDYDNNASEQLTLTKRPRAVEVGFREVVLDSLQLLSKLVVLNDQPTACPASPSFPKVVGTGAKLTVTPL